MYGMVCLCLIVIILYTEYRFFRRRLVFNAHALGSIGGKGYRNNLEAFRNSYKNGFRYFEIDIARTKDGLLVASHDTEKVSGITAEEFMRDGKEGTALNLDMVFDLMRCHTKIHMMLDYLPGYYDKDIPDQMKLIATEIQKSGVEERCILEVYSQENLEAVRETGFSNIQMFIKPCHQRVSPLNTIDDYINYLKRKNVRIVSYTLNDVIRHPVEVFKLKRNGFTIYSGIWNSMDRLWIFPQTRLLDVITTDSLYPVKK